MKAKRNIRSGYHRFQTIYWHRKTETGAAPSARDRERGEVVRPFECPRIQLPRLGLVLAMLYGSHTKPVPT